MKLWRIALALAIATSAADLVSAAPDGKIVIAQGTDPSTLDMTNHQEAPAANVGAQIFETLVERDQNLQPIPGLAAELPRAISPTLWEIRLRNGVKFHNGEDFKAESVKFSIERLINPSNKLRGAPRPIVLDRVEVQDSYTVRVHTTQPVPTFVKSLTLSGYSMYPPRAYAGKAPARTSSSGGPRTRRLCSRRTMTIGAALRGLKTSFFERFPTIPSGSRRSRRARFTSV